MKNRAVNAVLLCCIIPFVGCSKTEEIQSYRIEKSKSGLDIFDDAQQQASQPASLEPTHRMVVAISQRDDATWFFKITGAIAAVGQVEFKWTDFLKTIRFGNDGNPEWDLPEGWTVGEERAMRFSTLTIHDADSPVEVAISSLSANQDLLLNVNRWRRQLGLPPLEQVRMSLGEIESAAGKMAVFDERGRLGSGGGPPMMGQQPPSQPPTPAASKTAEFEFDSPEGWTTGKISMIVRVRFHKKVGEREAQIRVVDMPAAVNEWLANAQRWAGQVELSKDPEFLKQRTTAVTVDGIEGNRLNLIGDKDDKASQQAAVGAMIVRGESAWFFLLIGDRSIVVENEKAFDDFLESFKF